MSSEAGGNSQPEQAGATQPASDGLAAAAQEAAGQEQGAKGSPAATAKAAGGGGGAAASPAQTEHGAAAKRASFSILDLPDDLIARCFEPIDQAERWAAILPQPCMPHRVPLHAHSSAHAVRHLHMAQPWECFPCCRLSRVALVCKRFEALSLCADEKRLSVSITGARAVERVRQLMLWLPRNAPRIKYFGLKLAADEGAALDAMAEIENITTACLATFGALGGGQLEQLTIEAPIVLATTAWLPTLRRLKRLAICSPGRSLLLTGSLHFAEAEEFELAGKPITFSVGAAALSHAAGAGRRGPNRHASAGEQGVPLGLLLRESSTGAWAMPPHGSSGTQQAHMAPYPIYHPLASRWLPSPCSKSWSCNMSATVPKAWRACRSYWL